MWEEQGSANAKKPGDRDRDRDREREERNRSEIDRNREIQSEMRMREWHVEYFHPTYVDSPGICLPIRLF